MVQDFDIPECDGCGELYPRPELESSLVAALQAEFLKSDV